MGRCLLNIDVFPTLVLFALLLLIGVHHGRRISSAASERQDVADYKDDHTIQEENEMYPTSLATPEALHNDVLTKNLVDKLSQDSGDKMMDDHSETPNNSGPDGANYYADNMNEGVEQFMEKGFSSKNMGSNYYGDKIEQFVAKGRPSKTTDANYYGDNMKGDRFENFVQNETVQSKTKNRKTQEDVIEMKDLEEYRSYPNEAKVNEVPVKRNGEKYSALRTMKDAISADSSLIDDELKALDAEDLKLGTIQGLHSNQAAMTLPTIKSSKGNQKALKKINNVDKTVSANSAGSITSSLKSLTSQDPTMTSSPPADLDMDKITKELLGIGVDSNGKIRLEQNKHLNVASREDILPKVPFNHQSVTVKNITSDSSSELNLNGDFQPSNDDTQIPTDSSSIEGALKSLNGYSNMLSRNNTLENGGNSFNTGIENVQQLNTVQTINSMMVQNKTLEHVDTSALQPPSSENEILKEPSNTRQSHLTGDKKANLAPFYNRETPVHKAHFSSRKLSDMQNELLREMYRSRTNGGMKSNTIKAKQRSIVMSDGDLEKLQTMKKRKRKRRRRRKRKRFFINKRTSRSTNEVFAGAISYTDGDGREQTYTLGRNRLKYDDARRMCKEHHHGDLATISNVKEQDFVINEVVIEANDYWIGLDDRVDEGNFQWVDSTPVQYTHWGNMEPDDGTNNRRGSLSYHNEDCAILRESGEWNDVNCNDKHMFICKKPIVYPGTKDNIYTPIFTESVIKSNENIPNEKFMFEEDECNNKTRSGICEPSTDSQKQPGSEVVAGGNGGASSLHDTTARLPDDTDESVKAKSSLYEYKEQTSTTFSPEITKDIKASTATTEPPPNATLDTTISNTTRVLPFTIITPAPDIADQKPTISNHDLLALKAISEAVQDLEHHKLANEQALKSVDGLVDNLKDQFTKNNNSKVDKSMDITIDPGDARHNIWTRLKPINSPLDADDRTTGFNRSPETVQALCNLSCISNMPGCVESCRSAVLLMSPSEFIKALQSAKGERNPLTGNPIKQRTHNFSPADRPQNIVEETQQASVDTEPRIQGNMITSLKKNLTNYYNDLFTKSGYDSSKSGLNSYLEDARRVAQESGSDQNNEAPSLIPSKSWNLFKSNMDKAYVESKHRQELFDLSRNSKENQNGFSRQNTDHLDHSSSKVESSVPNNINAGATTGFSKNQSVSYNDTNSDEILDETKDSKQDSPIETSDLPNTSYSKSMKPSDETSEKSNDSKQDSETTNDVPRRKSNHLWYINQLTKSARKIHHLLANSDAALKDRKFKNLKDDYKLYKFLQLKDPKFVNERIKNHQKRKRRRRNKHHIGDREQQDGRNSQEESSSDRILGHPKSVYNQDENIQAREGEKKYGNGGEHSAGEQQQDYRQTKEEGDNRIVDYHNDGESQEQETVTKEEHQTNRENLSSQINKHPDGEVSMNSNQFHAKQYTKNEARNQYVPEFTVPGRFENQIKEPGGPQQEQNLSPVTRVDNSAFFQQKQFANSDDKLVSGEDQTEKFIESNKGIGQKYLNREGRRDPYLSGSNQNSEVDSLLRPQKYQDFTGPSGTHGPGGIDNRIEQPQGSPDTHLRPQFQGFTEMNTFHQTHGPAGVDNSIEQPQGSSEQGGKKPSPINSFRYEEPKLNMKSAFLMDQNYEEQGESSAVDFKNQQFARPLVNQELSPLGDTLGQRTAATDVLHSRNVLNGDKKGVRYSDEIHRPISPGETWTRAAMELNSKAYLQRDVDFGLNSYRQASNQPPNGATREGLLQKGALLDETPTYMKGRQASHNQPYGGTREGLVQKDALLDETPTFVKNDDRQARARGSFYRIAPSSSYNRESFELNEGQFRRFFNRKEEAVAPSSSYNGARFELNEGQSREVNRPMAKRAGEMKDQRGDEDLNSSIDHAQNSVTETIQNQWNDQLYINQLRGQNTVARHRIERNTTKDGVESQNLVNKDPKMLNLTTRHKIFYGVPEEVKSNVVVANNEKMNDGTRLTKETRSAPLLERLKSHSPTKDTATSDRIYINEFSKTKTQNMKNIDKNRHYLTEFTHNNHHIAKKSNHQLNTKDFLTTTTRKVNKPERIYINKFTDHTLSNQHEVATDYIDTNSGNKIDKNQQTIPANFSPETAVTELHLSTNASDRNKQLFVPVVHT